MIGQGIARGSAILARRSLTAPKNGHIDAVEIQSKLQRAFWSPLRFLTAPKWPFFAISDFTIASYGLLRRQKFFSTRQMAFCGVKSFFQLVKWPSGGVEVF
jgi:hypothetical protein